MGQPDEDATDFQTALQLHRSKPTGQTSRHIQTDFDSEPTLSKTTESLTAESQAKDSTVSRSNPARLPLQQNGKPNPWLQEYLDKIDRFQGFKQEPHKATVVDSSQGHKGMFPIQNKIKKEFEADDVYGHLKRENRDSSDDAENNRGNQSEKANSSEAESNYESNFSRTNDEMNKYAHMDVNKAFDADSMSAFVNMLNNLNPASNSVDVSRAGSFFEGNRDDRGGIKKDFTGASHKETFWGQLENSQVDNSKNSSVSQGRLGRTHRKSNQHPPGQSTDGKGSAYKCHKCGNAYARLHSLSRHVKFECGVAPKFECYICHKRSKHKHNLLLHMKTHAPHK